METKKSSRIRLAILAQTIIVPFVFYIAASIHCDSYNVNDWGVGVVGVTVKCAYGTCILISVSMWALLKTGILNKV